MSSFTSSSSSSFTPPAPSMTAPLPPAPSSSSSSFTPPIQSPGVVPKGLLSPDILFSVTPLVIDLTSESIKELLGPTINAAYSKLGITKLEVKNMFNIMQEKTSRTFIQLKLPTKIWEKGYLNVLNKYEKWVPMYMSSGKNSGNPNNWHPYLGTLNMSGVHSRGPKGIYENLKKFFTNREHLLHPGGFTLENGQYWSWFVKCGSWNTAFRMQIDEMIEEEKKRQRQAGEEDGINPRLENLRVLHKRLERINNDLFKNKLFDEKSIFTKPSSPYEQGYLCNNFFMLINETLRLLITTDKERLNLLIARESEEKTIRYNSFPISSVREDTNHFINTVINDQNIFGLPLFKKEVAKDAIYIKKIIEHNFKKIMARVVASRNDTGFWKKWLETLILFLKDAENIKPIGNLLNEIIDNEIFTESITPTDLAIRINKRSRGSSNTESVNLDLVPKNEKSKSGTSAAEGWFREPTASTASTAPTAPTAPTASVVPPAQKRRKVVLKKGGRKNKTRKSKRKRKTKRKTKRKKSRKRRRRKKTIRKRKKSRKKRRHPH